MAGVRPPVPITLQEIDGVSDLKGARALAKKFPKEVSLKKCSLPKMRERLHLAVKKWNGQMKDIDSLGETMQRRRDEDMRNRDKMLEFYVKLKIHMATMEDSMKQHIGTEFRNIDDKIKQMITQLYEPANKLVVAGETSSGKSTVLNIFLSDDVAEEEMLPVKLLSCTATICEISWADQQLATTVTKGMETDIPFSERHKYIYKESERDSRLFPHDLVRLQMPIPFLKSGITLIDSPGIGESTEMGNVLKEYILKNEVFGFVFTIASNRAGGVLPKFLNLLRTLSTDDYKDRFGQRKLDPRSCIFVANFWDEVPESNREATKEHIFKNLTELPFMNGFDPHKQVFFLDASFAYHSKIAGFVSDDFAHFIDGLGNFVCEEQKRKLNSSYHWIEGAIQRMLHPVRGFIRNVGQTKSLRKRNKGKSNMKLDECERRFKEAQRAITQLLETRKSTCADELFKYMQSVEAQKKIAKWKLGDMPSEESDDNWVIMEIKLDEAIDERVSDLMQDWEKQTRCITSLEAELTRMFTNQFEQITNELESIEREIRSTSSKLDSDVDNDTNQPVSEMVYNFPQSPRSEQGRDFNIAFGKTHGSDIMGRTADGDGILDIVASGPTMKALKNKLYKVANVVVNEEEKYRQNKLNYMAGRAKRVYEDMCNKAYIESVIADQLKSLSQFLTYMEETTLKVITSNRALLHQITEEKRNKEAVQNLYSPVEQGLVNLFDEVLRFGSDYMVADDFSFQDFSSHDFKFNAQSLFAGHAYGKLKNYSIPRNRDSPIKHVNVTLRRYRGFGIPPLRLSDRHTHKKCLRQFSRRNDVAKLLGMCTIDRDHVLVLEGKLHPARKHVLHDHPGKFGAGMQAQLNNNIGFLKDLGNALMFLHLKKLVHCEFSLDSIMVKHKGNNVSSPLLCNLSEPSTLIIKQNPKLAVGHYMHVPVEVLQNSEMYSHESDIYGLGIIMLELWYQKDVFAEFKSTVQLKDWCCKEDTGEALIEEAKHQNSKLKTAGKLPKEWKDLAHKCLHKKPSNRIGIRQWMSEWLEQKSRYDYFYQHMTP